MKRSLIILLPALFMLAACGTASQYASQQQFPDGIYYRPQPIVELLAEEDFMAMAAQNLAADSLRLHKKELAKLRAEEDSYSYYTPYYGFYGPYHYSPYYHSPYYYGPYYYTWRRFDPFYDRYWDPFWDPYWSPYTPHFYWGSSISWSPYWGGSPYMYGYGYAYDYYNRNGYAGGRYPEDRYSGTVQSVTGAGNFRRSGSMSSGSSSGYGAAGVRRSGSSSSYSGGSVTRAGSSSRSSYRRSGGYTVGSGNSSSSDYSTRSSSYSGSSSSYSGGSSGGGYSGGGHSGGGGGSTHSGGSSGGGGGRR